MAEAMAVADEPTGFWEPERDDWGLFRWTKQRFSLRAGDTGRYVRLEVASPTTGNTLTVRTPSGARLIQLFEGWQSLDLRTDGAELDFEVGTTFMPEGDSRVLGLMLREPCFHDDAALHDLLTRRHANAMLNAEEFAEGAEVLASYPTHLRVTSSKRCNIANEKPCVYCSWDWAKRMEQGSPEFTPDVLAGMGGFMELALAVNDCSYGEPPLEARFGEVVELATQGERTFEFTSNGQTLSAKKRRVLLGKTARVHVSIDAATAAGYNRYRDHRFELIVGNLRALCKEREETGNLPELFVSYIVMRSNLGEVAAFLRLMKDVGVDRVTFRTLYLEDRLDERRIEHYGRTFDYDEECLAASELPAVSKRCRDLGREIGITVGIEWDEFAVNSSGDAPAGEPICTEPWKTAYLLDRGIMPCCYGREAMIAWRDIDQTNLEASLREAFNSAPMRELRRDLSQGRLGKYCERAQGCPIVKARMGGLAIQGAQKHDAAASVPPSTAN